MKMRLWITLTLLAGIASRVNAQETPVEISKNELPRKAVCVICSAHGTGEGEEKAAAGVRYKGKAYYFCNVAEVAKFKKNPEEWLPLPLPRPAPELALKTLAGEEVKAKDYRGKVLLVDFWATWCKPCVETMPEMQKLHTRFAEKDFAVLGVSIDEKGDKVVRPFIEKRKFTYPILLDGGEKPVWQKFGVKAIPALFLIDREGNIVRQWTGKPGKKEVEQAVVTLLKSSEVKP